MMPSEQPEDQATDAAIDLSNQDGIGSPDAPAAGTPPASPDVVEQELGAQMDNIVPTRGYQLTPMVGLGGSAGGIQALTRFFEAMPPNPGLVFVVVLHLSPEHESTLAELLARHTAMRVVQAEDGMKVEANRVYVIPPRKYLASVDGHLRLTRLEPERGKRMTVDVFFRTLADSHGAHAAAVVLSGGDSDGAIGIKRIKERGGLTVAQDPDDAEQDGMPRAAIDTGMVDWVLPAAEIPARLLEYTRREKRLRLPSEQGPPPTLPPAPDQDERETALREILVHLHARTGHNFSYYKRATILRRVSRRLQINGIETLPEYLGFLRTHSGEAGALLQDMLISVTNFFRDRDAFAALETIIPQFFRAKDASDHVRVWVPACATGEEAYSVAMLLHEHARALSAPPPIQVFATDLSEDAVREAREGAYPLTISTDVSTERLARFFVKDSHGYRVRRELRETVLFAQHDLLKDSPFSRLDLVTCRNLLIYLNRHAQARALDIFHFALRPGGHLFLGTSESVDEDSGLFTPLDKKHRLYVSRLTPRVNVPVPLGPNTLALTNQARERAMVPPVLPPRPPEPPILAAPLRAAAAGGPSSETQLRMLAQFGPPVIIVNAVEDIIHLSGSASRYLQFHSGVVTRSLLEAVHPMLRIELRAALYRATQGQGAAYAMDVPVDLDGERQNVDIQVLPAEELAAGHLVVNLLARPAQAAASREAAAEADPVAEQLERQVETLKNRLRDLQEQHEVTIEEHRASGEELQAMNEELRSASEELETSREELQSINEELTTVNAELKARVDQLGSANSDLQNLMAATQIATVFLDRDLCITRFTPNAVDLFKIIPTDLGRPLDDLKHRLDYPDLQADAAQVLASLLPAERVIRKEGDTWFLARMQPYRTGDDRIAGVVLTFVDITLRRQAETALLKSEQQLRSFVEASSDTIYKMSADWSEMQVLEGRHFLTSTHRPIRAWLETYIPTKEQPLVLATIRAAIDGKRTFELEHRVIRADGTVGWTSSRAVPLLDARGEITEWFGAASDVTERRDAEEERHVSAEKYRALFESLDEGFCVVEVLFDDAGRVADYLFLDVNPAFERQTGLRDVAGKHMRELVPDHEEHWFEIYARIARTGQAERFENHAAALGRWFDVYAWRYGAPEERQVAILFRDETERRQAAEQVRVSEERYRHIVESAHTNAIFTMDSRGGITSWNPGAESIFGWPAAEIIGRSIFDLLPPESRNAGYVARHTDLAVREGRCEYEDWFVRRDGSRFWGSGVLSPLPDSGTVPGFLKIMRDRTEELRTREAQEEMERERARLRLEVEQVARRVAEEANRAKDHFLAVLSHELRTPLMPISMALGALKRRPDLPEDVRRAHEMIRRNVDLEARFIDDMLDVTRIARGKMEVVRADMDLHEAVRRAVEVSAPDFAAKNQPLRVDIEDGECIIQGDSARLQQVFWNLLKNASKFTPPGGAITVRSWCPDDETHLTEVTDTGIGLEAEAIERIFNPFEQASVAIMREFGGLGLGLAIAKATVEAHGGTLRVSSRGVGRGATFTVNLPRLAPTGQTA